MGGELTQEELLEITRASPGPWCSYIEGRDHTSGSNFIMVGEGANRREDIELIGATPDDQGFVAHARQDIPRLLQEIGRLRALLATRGSR